MRSVAGRCSGWESDGELQRQPLHQVNLLSGSKRTACGGTSVVTRLKILKEGLNNYQCHCENWNDPRSLNGSINVRNDVS